MKNRLKRRKPGISRAFFQILTQEVYFFVLSTFIVEAESTVIVVVESVVIVVVSVDMVAVESTVVSSVLGLLWQAANASVLPTNRIANNFFIGTNGVFLFSSRRYLVLKSYQLNGLYFL